LKEKIAQSLLKDSECLRYAGMHLGSISSTFYEQLLHTKIPKVQRDSQVINVFFALLGPARAKAACKTLQFN